MLKKILTTSACLLFCASAVFAQAKNVIELKGKYRTGYIQQDAGASPWDTPAGDLRGQNQRNQTPWLNAFEMEFTVKKMVHNSEYNLNYPELMVDLSGGQNFSNPDTYNGGKISEQEDGSEVFIPEIDGTGGLGFGTNYILWKPIILVDLQFGGSFSVPETQVPTGSFMAASQSADFDIVSGAGSLGGTGVLVNFYFWTPDQKAGIAKMTGKTDSIRLFNGAKDDSDALSVFYNGRFLNRKLNLTLSNTNYALPKTITSETTHPQLRDTEISETVTTTYTSIGLSYDLGIMKVFGGRWAAKGDKAAQLKTDAGVDGWNSTMNLVASVYASIPGVTGGALTPITMPYFSKTLDFKSTVIGASIKLGPGILDLEYASLEQPDLGTEGSSYGLADMGDTTRIGYQMTINDNITVGFSYNHWANKSQISDMLNTVEANKAKLVADQAVIVSAIGQATYNAAIANYDEILGGENLDYKETTSIGIGLTMAFGMIK